MGFQLQEDRRLKPRLLIIGHARHGKDEFAKQVSKAMNLRFTSSSHFVGTEFIWPFWGKTRYDNYEEFFEDRVNHRPLWANMITAYNTPDKTKTASTMFDRGNNLYVGMRRRDELEACAEDSVFDIIIWVDASVYRDPEPVTSMELTKEDADWYIDNNSMDPQTDKLNKDFDVQIGELQQYLHDRGFDVGLSEEPLEKDVLSPPKLEDRSEWFDAPEGATKVLDHGFFQVKAVYGTDADICNAARMSYGRGTKRVNEDAGLIKYLVTNNHTSPLEMASIKFHFRLPIFVMRQLVRQRTARLNEYSGRYSEMVRLFYIPEAENICHQHSTNKQRSSGPIDKDDAARVRDLILLNGNDCFDRYEKIMNTYEVSRETARMVLPLNTYTEVVWKIDVSNMLKFLYLRDDSHSQWEIQVYAKEVAKALEEHFPSVYKAYMLIREQVTLSQPELEALVSRDLSALSKSEESKVRELLAKEAVFV